MTREPDPQTTCRELIGRDGPAVDDEPCDRRIGCFAVRFESLNARGAVRVCVARAFERVGDGLSNPAGLDTPFPAL